MAAIHLRKYGDYKYHIMQRANSLNANLACAKRNGALRVTEKQDNIGGVRKPEMKQTGCPLRAPCLFRLFVGERS